MKALAIDTSCDDSSVAIINFESKEILADIVFSHTRAMRPYGGVVPEIASREHLRSLPRAVESALEHARLKPKDLDWICATHRPGLIGALLVGVSYAKALAYGLGKPLSVINHIEGHLFSPFLDSNRKIPELPWIALVVSGGHTEMFRVGADYSIQELGATLDDAAGEAFDKIGKLLGLEYPAGAQIDRWVRQDASDPDRCRFPLRPAQTPDYSFSFSGLKTAVRTLMAAESFTESDKLALAASAQEAILQSLIVKIDRAKEGFPGHRVVITGGVACNSRLRRLLPDAYFPAPKHCTDNAAMIAMVAALQWHAGRLAIADWNVSAMSR